MEYGIVWRDSSNTRVYEHIMLKYSVTNESIEWIIMLTGEIAIRNDSIHRVLEAYVTWTHHALQMSYNV